MNEEQINELNMNIDSNWTIGIPSEEFNAIINKFISQAKQEERKRIIDDLEECKFWWNCLYCDWVWETLQEIKNNK